MPDKPFWPAEAVRDLRQQILVDRDGEKVVMNQEAFGDLLGGYTQPTISLWENNGCTSRRGCSDLQRVKGDLIRAGVLDG